MSCSNCIKIKPIASCFESLQIGRIAPNTDVLAVFEDLATGRLIISDVITSAPVTGVLYFNQAITLVSNHPYRFWLTIPGETPSDTYPFELIGGTDITDCLEVTFYDYIDNANSGALLSLAFQTFLLA